MLSQDFLAGKLPLGFWLAADDAYEQSNFMLTPYSVTSLLKHLSELEKQEELLARDGFNFWQSSLRIVIECAFGMLVRRWGVFWRAMEGTLKHTQLIVAACMSLHNVCIDEKEGKDAENADLMEIPVGSVEGFHASHAPRTWRDTERRVHTSGRPVVHDQGDCTTQSVRGQRSDLAPSKLRDELKIRLSKSRMPRPSHSRYGLTEARLKAKHAKLLRQRTPLC